MSEKRRKMKNVEWEMEYGKWKMEKEEERNENASKLTAKPLKL